MIPNREWILLCLGLAIIFKIFFFGKIICWFRQKHAWNRGVLWRECNTCGKKQYLDMRNSRYVD
jgi:hypothetical protein